MTYPSRFASHDVTYRTRGHHNTCYLSSYHCTVRHNTSRIAPLSPHDAHGTTNRPPSRPATRRGMTTIMMRGHPFFPTHHFYPIYPRRLKIRHTCCCHFLTPCANMLMDGSRPRGYTPQGHGQPHDAPRSHVTVCLFYVQRTGPSPYPASHESITFRRYRIFFYPSLSPCYRAFSHLLSSKHQMPSPIILPHSPPCAAEEWLFSALAGSRFRPSRSKQEDLVHLSPS